MPVARDIVTVGCATLASRVMGFARDAGVAALLGATPVSDAYLAAMQIPNLFRRLLAEGGLNGALTPIWRQLPPPQRPDFAAQALALTVMALATGAVIAAALTPLVIHALAPGFTDASPRFTLAVSYLRLALPYVALAGVAATAAAILNAQRRVGAAAASVLAFNAVLLAAVIALWIASDPASPQAGAMQAATLGAILAASFVAAGFVQAAIVLFAVMRGDEKPRRLVLTPSRQTRAFFAKALPGLIAAGIPQVALIAGAMVASPSPAAVSWLYYAYRLYELPLGVIATIVASVMTPHLANAAADRDADISGPPIEAAQRHAFEIALGLALPAAAGLAILAQPIAAALFQHGAFGPRDTAMVAAALTAIAAGLPGHALEKVLGAISFSHHDTATPMRAALLGLLAAVTGALLLFPEYGHVGVAGAVATGGWVGSAILGARLVRQGRLRLDRTALRRLLAIVAASAAMAAALFAANAVAPSPAGGVAQAILLAGEIAFGLAVYLAALAMLGVTTPWALAAAVRGD